MKTFGVVLLCSLPFWVWGQQHPLPDPADTLGLPLYRLNEVIVVGNSMEDPAMTQQSQDLSQNVVQPRNVADLFGDLPGFHLIRRGNYAIDPAFRAAQYEQLNVQFDAGTRVMHACPNRMDPITTHVSPEEIERVELVRGPFTVRYGPVFAGLINLVTQDPREAGTGLHGALSSGYESNGDSYLTTLRLQQVWEHTDLGANLGWRDFGDYTDGDGQAVPASFESLDYKLQLGHNFTARQRVEMNWRQSFGRDVLHAGLPMDTEYDNSSVLSADYTWRANSQAFRGIFAKAYHAFVDHLMTNELRPNYETMEAIAKVQARSWGGRLESRWKPGGTLDLYLGADLNAVARDGNRDRLVKRNMMGMPLAQPMAYTDKIWQDSYVNQAGTYLETRWAAFPSGQVTAGVRMDAVWSDIRDPEADFQALYPNLGYSAAGYVSGNLSLRTRLNPGLLLEIALGRGVRPAGMIERYINHFTVGQDPYEYVGNPNLRAEVNHQAEVGFKGEWNLPAGPVSYELSTFYSALSDYIMAVIDPSLSRKYMPNAEPSEVKRFINLERAYKTGFEGALGLALWPGLRTEVNLAYVYSRNRDLGEALPLTPPFSGTFRLAYQKSRYWARADFRFTAKQTLLAPSFGETETPGYGLVDLRLGINPTPQMQVGLAALNVLNHSYYDHLNFALTNQGEVSGNRIREPGRNLSVYLKYTL
ncbi:TonB-dependent receptor [Robiginitalea sp. M366]|uniref:TonB-dependent receptor n=1 Tax=Robiginitalea aestuariiviva TaxID=3036903 RepID=UPI00240DBEB7|nr:TonB-dependent receptor [Robiginitalea aestuariiviva]MDG1573359.1 TonB-dependent receptor [Robiginitalea aestuariiviva]